MSTILTYKKHRFSPISADVKDIDIYDIAHALSRLPRANGHFSEFFSVARHCINCAVEAEKRDYPNSLVLQIFLHDASEAYIADIVRPVKNKLPDYLVIEKKLQDTIFKTFGVEYTEDSLKLQDSVDNAMLYYEFVYFADEKLYNEAPIIASNPDFSYMNFDTTEQLFLDYFNKYIEKRN